MGMKQRCSNPNATNYARYGGRGIAVCQRWQESFLAFLEDLGPRPSKGHTLERRNNNGDYEPDNCYWATRKQQGRNRANNRVYTHNNTTLCLAEWAEILDIDEELLRSRMKSGWSFEMAISMPVLPQREGRQRTETGRFAPVA
jgi:hypothetical protein